MSLQLDRANKKFPQNKTLNLAVEAFSIINAFQFLHLHQTTTVDDRRLSSKLQTEREFGKRAKNCVKERTWKTSREK